MNVSLFDTALGLPVHALVVHATVVAVPVAVLAVLAIGLRPAWRRRFGVPVAAFAVAMVPLVGLTVLSGRAFKNRIGATPQIRAHESLGNTVFWLTLAVAVVAVLLVWLQRRASAEQHPGALVTGVAVVAVVVAAVTLVQVVRTGHAGSVAVWESVVQSTGG